MSLNSEEDLLKSIEELVAIMLKDPAHIDRKLLEEGAKFIGIYEDSNFGDKFKNNITLKEQIFKDAILDISAGAPLLSMGVMGIKWLNNNLERYYNYHDETTPGTVVFSISLKSMTAFKNYRQKDQDDLAQDELNTSCYKLIYHIAHGRKIS